jgi:hypothetical protein
MNKNEVGRVCITYGEIRNAYRVLMGKYERKRLFERPRLRRQDNIKMNIREVRKGVAWTGLIWLRIGTSGGLLCMW